APDACALTTVDDNTGVFVSPTGTDASNCGTSRTAPCKTISAAISTTKGVAGRTHVYVAAGQYVEALTILAGITVEGGWHATGTTWTFDCGGTAASLVTVQAPPTNNVTVTASAIGGAATLSTMTV